MPLNFRAVEPGVLYRSGGINPIELESLTKSPYNIRRIISLDINIGKIIDPYVKKLGIEHIIFPINPNADVRGPSYNMYTQAYRLFMPPKGGGAILIHCRHGKDRTGFAVALYRVMMRGWTCERALQEAESLGYGQGLSIPVKNQFNSIICKACKVAHTHICATVKQSAQKDIIDMLSEQLYLKHEPANVTPPITNTPVELTELTVTPQQSFAPFAGTGYESGVGVKTDVLSNDDKMLARKRKLRKKLLLKLLGEKDTPLPTGVGNRDNYNGVSDSYLNAPSGSPGAPGAASPSEPSGTVQIW